MSGEEEPTKWGLVMPFIVCKSQGGPYDDVAFVQGGRLQQVVGWCESGIDPIESMQSPGLLPQLDLVAMQYGYTLTHVPWDEHPDEWTAVTMVKAEPGHGEGGGDRG